MLFKKCELYQTCVSLCLPLCYLNYVNYVKPVSLCLPLDWQTDASFFSNSNTQCSEHFKENECTLKMTCFLVQKSDSGKVPDLLCCICMHRFGTNCTEMFYRMINRHLISAVVEGFKGFYNYKANAENQLIIKETYINAWGGTQCFEKEFCCSVNCIVSNTLDLHLLNMEVQ